MAQDSNQITVMARSAMMEDYNRILGARNLDIDQTLADLDQLIAVQQETVDALDERLDALHACRAVYVFGDHRQTAEALEKERQALDRLQRSQRGLLRVKAQRDKEV